MTPETSSIVTILGVFIANAAIVIPLFLWNRAESRSDIRYMDAKLDSNRELIREVHLESKDMLIAIRKENTDLINAIREDMHDFHNRLCLIEERSRGLQ